MRDQPDLVPFFVPSLGSLLLAAEEKNGGPLTEAQVLAIRDQAAVIMMERKDADAMAAKRGRDIDPENCWFDFQKLRRSLGRKPDLNPGAQVNRLKRGDPEMGRAMQQANDTLSKFDELLGLGGHAMIKTRIIDGETTFYLWLEFQGRAGERYVGKVFELPPGLNRLGIGAEVVVEPSALVDWLVNDRGSLHGGFTLRVHRERLPQDERGRFDQQLGVSRYS
jgi:uncharacterized protein YegJ (DUF2314 family)